MKGWLDLDASRFQTGKGWTIAQHGELFLGQIENHLRDLVERMKLSAEELRSLADERDVKRADISRVDDLTLGELIRVMQNMEYARQVLWRRWKENHEWVYPNADVAVITNRDTGHRWILRRGSDPARQA